MTRFLYRLKVYWGMSMSKENSVYINTYASVSAGANSSQELFKNICNHESGIVIDNRFSFGQSVAIGLIQNEKSFEQNLIDSVSSVVEQSDIDPTQTILLIGSCVGGIYISEECFFAKGNYETIDPQMHHIQALTHIISKKYNFKKSISFSTACTSSANALGYAYELLSKGIYKDIIVVGADSISHTTVNGFKALEVLSSKPCTPFDKNRKGMNVSEAVAVLHLSNAKSTIEMHGVGYSSDAHHITQPHPEGEGAVRAIGNALRCANIKAHEIGYINAHGTGTPANDFSEAKAIAAVFDKTPVSSTKSITGHTLGAAGALEAIITIEALKNQMIPPNTNLNEPENEALFLPKESMKKKFEYALSNSFAFGGNNTAVVLGLNHES